MNAAYNQPEIVGRSPPVSFSVQTSMYICIHSVAFLLRWNNVNLVAAGLVIRWLQFIIFNFILNILK